MPTKKNAPTPAPAAPTSEPIEPKRSAGRPTFIPSEAQRQIVQVLKANAISHTAIAQKIGVDPKTLMKHFRDELDTGFEQVKASVGAAIVRAALNGNMFAAKYWMSTHGGTEWRVTEGRDHSGKIEHENLTDDELRREIDAIRARRRTVDGERDMEAEGEA